jgi:Ca2+-binding EF-hand superfamily protein
MKTRLITHMSTLALTMALSTVAFAGGMIESGAMKSQGGQSQSSAWFSKLDSNHDGYLTRNEIERNSKLAEDWSTADKNQDDKISRGEFSAFEAGIFNGGSKTKNNGSKMKSGGSDY